MTREDIIRIAREAGCIKEDWLETNTRFLGRFAALIAAAEREACAKVCEEMWTNYADLGAICAAAIRARGNT